MVINVLLILNYCKGVVIIWPIFNLKYLDFCLWKLSFSHNLIPHTNQHVGLSCAQFILQRAAAAASVQSELQLVSRTLAAYLLSSKWRHQSEFGSMKTPVFIWLPVNVPPCCDIWQPQWQVDPRPKHCAHLLQVANCLSAQKGQPRSRES